MYTICGTGKCQFRTPDGKLVDDLPDPRRKKGAPADTPLGRLDPSLLVYDAVVDPADKCGGNCRCYILIQEIDRATAKVVTERLRSADGDDKNCLTKREHDNWIRDADQVKRNVKFSAACIEMERDKTTNELVPKQ